VSTLDVLVLVPLIPVAPIVITWWLPWERWIPWGKLPKAVLGPYLLYASFAAWRFGLSWWLVLGVGLVGTVLSVIAVLEKAN
jgi:hypothetical protein